MTILYQKILHADGYIFATPVYFGSVTSTMKTFMDRTVPLTWLYYQPESTSEFKSILRLRPATGIAISAVRNDGIETALVTMFRYFLYHDMMPIGSQTIRNKYASSFGGAIVSDDKSDAINRDRTGIGTLHAIGKKVAILSKHLKPVRMALSKQTF
jgi:multimeric flavodoxin WrbA